VLKNVRGIHSDCNEHLNMHTLIARLNESEAERGSLYRSRSGWLLLHGIAPKSTRFPALSPPLAGKNLFGDNQALDLARSLVDLKNL
jgi:hypothetical protein